MFDIGNYWKKLFSRLAGHIDLHLSLNMKMKAHCIFLFSCLILMLSFIVPNNILAAKAQGVPELSIQPGSANVITGDSIWLDVYVASGQDLNAFDLTITYDKDVITLETWSFGDFMTNLSPVYLSDQPGEFIIAATQLSSSGASGNGILLKLNFHGKNPGTSTVDIIDAKLATITSELIIPTTQPGVVRVINQPTFTSTPRFTKTPTATTTFTATRTAEKTPTKTMAFVSTTVTPEVGPTNEISALDTPLTGTAIVLLNIPQTQSTTVEQAQLITPDNMPITGLEKNSTENSVIDEDHPNLELINTLLWVFGVLLVGFLVGLLLLNYRKIKK
jgi:hypothetical protein